MTKQRIKAEAKLSEGAAPAGVQIDVVQGGVLQSAVAPADEPSASFDLDPGDYEARATALVPHGAPATAVFAVPIAVRVTAAD